MTFKDIKKRVSLVEAIQEQQSKTLERLYNKPFWIWDIEEHKKEDIRTKGDCCFNHIIGLPTKGRIEKPLFDYEKLLFDYLLVNDYSNILNHTFKHKHLWVKKATGLGVTEFFVRLMAWLCLRNDDYRNSQMCIVTGPNIDIAIKLIKRMKGLFEEKIQALSLAKECYSMKLDLLTNATVVDDAIRFVSDRSKEKLKSSSDNSNEDGKESNEPDYDEDKDQLEEKQEEETREITSTTINQVF